MPKHEPLTAKAIGKRIKAKGLQKLKYYCQMCQKQCRDENGFKCHMTSEAHQRQLLLFAENPNKYMDSFSGEFLKDFLHLLKRRYSSKRVHANQVYQEYIKDRNHLHMNATRWVTLSGFVKWMGRKGICHVENNEKGWFITYIDRDPETLLKQESLAKKEKMAKDDEERQAKIIADQIKRGLDLEKKNKDSEDENWDEASEEGKLFRKESGDHKIAFTLTSKLPEKKQTLLPKPIAKDEPDSEKSDKPQDKPKKNSKDLPAKRKSALDEIIEEQERWKAKKSKSANPSQSLSWLLPDILVRVVVPDLGQQYFNRKAVVQSVQGYAARIRMVDSGDLLQVDEQHLETVVPRKGVAVKVLRGLYRERRATVEAVDERRERVSVRVREARSGPVELAFDHISRLAE